MWHLFPKLDVISFPSYIVHLKVSLYSIMVGLQVKLYKIIIDAHESVCIRICATPGVEWSQLFHVFHLTTYQTPTPYNMNDHRGSTILVLVDVMKY